VKPGALIAKIEPHERRAFALAFACNFMLLGSYYILRPVRDAMSTILGVEQLPNVYVGTLVLTLLASPIFAWLVDTFKVSRVLPGVFAFLIIDLLGFYVWMNARPMSYGFAVTFYWWFSVINLFMISVFFSLMVDTFTSTQAARLLPTITAGGSLGAIAGPALASVFSTRVGVSGLLLMAAAGLGLVIVLVLSLIREKRRLLDAHVETQASTMDHALSGTLLDGFRATFTSSYLVNQALFIMLMTWIATIGYFLQTEMIAEAFAGLSERTRALANIDFVVNVCSAVVAMFGVSRFIARFGVTGGLIINPILMVISFVLMALSPTLLMLQAMQALRRVSQYAIARPCREICFTVVDQESRYKAKNFIDTVVYRFGDLASAWMQKGMELAGFGMIGTLGLGIVASGIWAVNSLSLGRQYERRRAQTIPRDDETRC
jgi:AAA family ATP:ADP antiporter